MSILESWELERWIKSIGRGDRDALADLYKATASPVYAYALSILKNRHDAQDAMHDTYVSVWSSSGSYRPQGKPMAWILTITRNHCRMLLRRQSRVVSLEDNDLPELTCQDPADGIVLKQCMALLSEEERQIVVLHAAAGMTHRQIADMLELKTSTVLSKYHRAIAKLRKQI